MICVGKDEVIAIARQGPAGVADIPAVLDVARNTGDRRQFAICRAKFSAVR